MALIVYGGSLSPFVRKVRVVLFEKGIEYKLEQINPFAPPPAFVEISPLRRIPVLRDTDIAEPNTVPDSSVIADYLEHKYPTPSLYPRVAFARARALWYEEYADTALFQAAGPGLFFERIVKKMMGQTPDEAIVAATLNDKLPPIFDYLEREVGSKSYLVGGGFSIADIAVAAPFVNIEHAGERVDAERWPELARYVRAILARPSFKAMIDHERPVVERVRAA
ncbi:MAG: glutathione S-transferase family protein [Rhizomicrobium sp.]